MKISHLLLLITFLFSVNVFGQQFEMTLHGQDNGGVGRTLTFGVHPLATYCEDESLGENNNYGPPPFPFVFTWVNPGITGICDNDFCFDCGRLIGSTGEMLDLRPYISPAQVDTYRICMFSFDAGYPFFLSWEGVSLQKCDSMKLVYTGDVSGTVTVDMFASPSHVITDPSVLNVDIIKYGAYGINPFPPTRQPVNHTTGLQLFTRLLWDSTAGANGYEYEVSGDSLFTTDLYRDTVAGNSKYIGPLTYFSTYYWRVRALLFSGPGSWTDAWDFRTTGATYTYPVSGKWNLVSIPLEVDDPRKNILFPSATTNAYSYSSAGGYVQEDTLRPGVGYWLKFATAGGLPIAGNPITDDTIDVLPGWNIIGSLNDSTFTDDIVSLPPGNITSFYFGYSGGHTLSDVISPAKGYWVKANDTGKIILSSSMMSARKSSVASANNMLEKLNRVTITDAEENSQVLYFGAMGDDEEQKFSFELPPVPAKGIFDARFGSHQFAEFTGVNVPKEVPVIISSGAYPVAIRWDIPSKATMNGILKVDGKEVPMAGNGTTIIDNPKAKIVLRMTTGKTEVAPLTYSLSQNYPNPFNPETKIAYALPSEEHVRIIVYNALGQEVATLVDEIQAAGQKSVTFNANNLPSGIYTYRITSGTFSAVKKMMLVK